MIIPLLVCIIYSHATLGLYKKLLQRAPRALNRYITPCHCLLQIFFLHRLRTKLTFFGCVLFLSITDWYYRWEYCAQPKVVVKIESEEEMLVLQVSLLNICVIAEEIFLPFARIVDRWFLNFCFKLQNRWKNSQDLMFTFRWFYFQSLTLLFLPTGKSKVP